MNELAPEIKAFERDDTANVELPTEGLLETWFEDGADPFFDDKLKRYSCENYDQYVVYYKHGDSC
jgi:hypothetical protein